MASAEGAKAGLLAGAAFRPWLKHKLWITLQSTITHNNFIHHNSKEKAGNGCGKTEWSFETVRATFRRSLIALSWEAPCYSKPPPSFHLTDSSLRKTPFTVAFPQRAKIWLCCFLSSFFFFLSPEEPCFGRDPISLFSKEHFETYLIIITKEKIARPLCWFQGKHWPDRKPASQPSWALMTALFISPRKE